MIGCEIMDKIVDMKGNVLSSNEVAVFNQKYLAVFKQLAELSIAKKKLMEKEKEIKEQMKGAMEEYDIKSIDNEHIRISYVAEGKPSVKVDLNSLEKDDSSLYKELLNRYPKYVKPRSSYISFRAKKST